jgi:hypothetical protein
MNLRDIEDAAKIALGSYLFRPQADGGAWELIALDPMVKMYAEHKLKPSQEALVEQQEYIGGLETKIREVTAWLQAADLSGDALAGALDMLIEGALRYPGLRAGLADELRSSATAIFKDGLVNLTRAGYGALGGEADLIERRMSASMWQAVGRLEVDGVSGATMLREWLANAREITRKDQERSALGVQFDPERVSRGQTQQVRNAWVRAMHALVALIEGSDVLDDAQRDAILAPLQEAERRAAEARRAAQPPAPAEA